MPKRPLKLSVRIPPYRAPRNEWRRQIHGAVFEKLRSSEVSYTSSDRLEIRVRLYMDDISLSFHDVDNRLKDIMDALQGHVGGSKTTRRLRPIVPNDSQIYRVVVEKGSPPRQSLGLGHLTIRGIRRADSRKPRLI